MDEDLSLTDLPSGRNQRPYSDAMPQFLPTRVHPTDPALAFSVPSGGYLARLRIEWPYPRTERVSLSTQEKPDLARAEG